MKTRKTLTDHQRQAKVYDGKSRKNGIPTDGAWAKALGFALKDNPFKPNSSEAIVWDYKWGCQNSIDNGGC